MFDDDTWPKCCVEFFYGDAVPNMTERGKKGNGTVYVPMQDLFAWLQDREELEYHLPSDAERYKARPTSRFDTSECTAIFGSVLRHTLLLKGVGYSVSQARLRGGLKRDRPGKRRGLRGHLDQFWKACSPAWPGSACICP